MPDRVRVWERPERGVIRPALAVLITTAGTALAVAGSVWEQVRRG